MLEGWAIVDNTTGEDWTNVQLSLVSGRPISFISQLVRAEVHRAAGRRNLPRISAARAGGARRAAVEMQPGERRMRAMPGAPRQAQAWPPMMAAAPARRRNRRRPMRQVRSAPARSSPHAHRAAKSANCSNTASPRRSPCARTNPPCCLSCSRRSTRASCSSIPINPRMHPMNAAEIHQLHRQDAGWRSDHRLRRRRYAGEALMETLKTGDKRLISYARRPRHPHHHGVRFQGRRSSAKSTRTRHAHHRSRPPRRPEPTPSSNVDPKAKTLIIEHPAAPGIHPARSQAAEKTPRAYRFEVKLAAGATEKFPVTEERVYDQLAMRSPI